jgi:transcriptional regulator GlxA family with amidase domain
VSVCTGAFLLAAGGLLDGLAVTTHWAWCDALAAEYPGARVLRDPIFVRAGRIWTSAGVTAGIDLCLALVEADLGQALSLAVARQLVVFARRPGGQAQFSEALAAESLAEPFAALAHFVKANLRGNLSVPRLAAKIGLSERSFLRHWRHPSGATPARWVELVRLEAAQAALGRPGASLKRVAVQCGFGSEESVRRSFQRVLGVSPGAWRARFGS